MRFLDLMVPPIAGVVIGLLFNIAQHLAHIEALFAARP
jgi:hypothetical protein